MGHSEITNRDLPLSVADLFSRHLQRQINAHAEGLGYVLSDHDVVPHEAGPVQPVDPRLAFNDAIAAGGLFLSGSKVAWSVPPNWPALVNQLEPAVALSFSLGNFPQLVRNLYPLLTSAPTALRLPPQDPLPVPGLLDWAAQVQDEAARLLAAGVLRLARHFDRAEQLLAETPPPGAGSVSDGLQALHANETAALAWHRGEAERALQLWQSQPDSAPVLFNRGMAALFLGDSGAARAALEQAIATLPETSAWHHLAGLYLTLARS